MAGRRIAMAMLLAMPIARVMANPAVKQTVPAMARSPAMVRVLKALLGFVMASVHVPRVPLAIAMAKASVRRAGQGDPMATVPDPKAARAVLPAMRLAPMANPVVPIRKASITRIRKPGVRAVRCEDAGFSFFRRSLSHSAFLSF